MPVWVETGVAEYRKRLPKDFELVITEVPLACGAQRGNGAAQRSKNSDLARALTKEGDACLLAVNRADYIIALDVKGVSQSTEQLALQLGKLRDTGLDVAMLVGGPDGLSPACLQIASARWSLSALTFPHPIVRVILAEQIYRAWSVLINHPYHRS